MRYLISITISALMIFQPAFATLNNVDKTQIWNKNLLTNGGFENGKALWTASAGTFAVTTSSPMIGSQHATWDAAASANTLVTTALAIPVGMYGRNGVVSCLFTTASGTSTHEIQAYDGSNVLSETTITSSTSPTRVSANFIFPSSGNIQLQIYANADEPSVAIDDCYLGPAEGYNVSSVSQATFAGESYFLGTASCNWARTSATIGAFTADAQCPGPTIVTSTLGTWATTDVDLPEQTITNLPPGIYEATFIFNANSSVVSNIAYAINDGTTTCNAVGGSTATTPAGHVVSCSFTYTSAGTRNFELYAASAASTANLNGDVTSPQQHIRFMLKRFPTSSEQAYTPDLQAMSWSGYHDSTCVWSRTNTAFGDFTADASCAMTERTNQNFGTVSTSGSVLPAITFTPKKAGRYYVCAIANAISGGTTSNTWALQLIDGASTVVAQATGYTPANGAYQASMCGVYVVTSLSAKTLTIQSKVSSSSIAISGGAVGSSVEWSIFSLDQSLPAPVLTNMVTTGSSGGVKIDVANINCDAGSAITSQNGSWVSSVGNVSGGACAVTLTTGNYSATPYCWASPNAAFASVGLILSTAQSSATAVSVDCEDDASGACTSYDFNLFCIGAR